MNQNVPMANGFYPNETYARMTGGLPATDPHGFYQPNVPVPYCDACTAGLYPQGGGCSCPACRPWLPAFHRQGVGQLPPPSSESEQAQVSGQLSERMVVIGVLAALAAAAVIYQTRKR
jgi:hypothetical protein